jgi:hypothetical protein
MKTIHERRHIPYVIRITELMPVHAIAYELAGQANNGGNMKSISFWRREVLSLSLTERMFFRDAIRTLQSWDTIKEEYSELDLIRRILESELRMLEANNPGEETKERNPLFIHHCVAGKATY